MVTGKPKLIPEAEFVSVDHPFDSAEGFLEFLNAPHPNQNGIVAAKNGLGNPTCNDLLINGFFADLADIAGGVQVVTLDGEGRNELVEFGNPKGAFPIKVLDASNFNPNNDVDRISLLRDYFYRLGISPDQYVDEEFGAPNGANSMGSNGNILLFGYSGPASYLGDAGFYSRVIEEQADEGTLFTAEDLGKYLGLAEGTKIDPKTLRVLQFLTSNSLHAAGKVLDRWFSNQNQIQVLEHLIRADNSDLLALKATEIAIDIIRDHFYIEGFDDRYLGDVLGAMTSNPIGFREDYLEHIPFNLARSEIKALLNSGIVKWDINEAVFYIPQPYRNLIIKSMLLSPSTRAMYAAQVNNWFRLYARFRDEFPKNSKYWVQCAKKLIDESTILNLEADSLFQELNT